MTYLHNGEIYNLYSSQDIVEAINWKVDEWDRAWDKNTVQIQQHFAAKVWRIA